MVRDNSVLHAFDGDAVTVRHAGPFGKRVAADERLALVGRADLEGEILSRLKRRQRFAVVRREVEGADIVVLLLFFDDAEFAETIPGRLGAFAFDASLVGDEADAFAQIIALEFGGLHHCAIDAPLAEHELNAGKRDRREADDCEELKRIIHFLPGQVRGRKIAEKTALINTLLQRGVKCHRTAQNHFNGFTTAGKTVETVFSSSRRCITPLKRGVNERRNFHHVENVLATFKIRIYSAIRRAHRRHPVPRCASHTSHRRGESRNG